MTGMLDMLTDTILEKDEVIDRSDPAMRLWMRKLIIALLEKLRDPTEGMTNPILNEGYGGIDTHEHVAFVWRAMIDAILAGK